MVDVVVFNFDAPQHIVPALAAFLLHLLHIVIAQFQQIPLSLLHRDKRRGDACRHLLATTGFERHNSTGVPLLGILRAQPFARHRHLERLVERDDEVVAEILRHTAAVADAIARDALVGLVHIDVRALVERIHHDVGLVGSGIGELHQHGAVGRSHLGRHVVVGQIDTIIIRCRRLCLVRIPRGTLLFVEDRLAHGRQDGELPVVVDPRTGLVGLFQSAYLRGTVHILPPVAHLPRLRHPEIHAPRHSDGGIGVAR